MATKIPWVVNPDGTPGETINPLGWGCYGPHGTAEHPRPCSYCFAVRLAKRSMRGCPDCAAFRPHWHPEQLEKLAHWKKPRTIFVQSMGDLFGEGVAGQTINAIWNEMFNHRQHRYILLTKRPDNLLRWTQEKARAVCWPIEDIWPNWIWLGVTAESQAEADERIPLLLETPAAVRFVSVEPLQGPINLTALGVHSEDMCGCDSDIEWCPYADRRLNWVIIGNDSRPGQPLPDPIWVDSLISQCRAAGVAIFIKGALAERWPITEWPEVLPDAR